MSDAKLYAEWVSKIESALRHEQKFRTAAKEAVDAFEGGSGTDHVSGTQYNILWANTETLSPLMYARTPIPDVRPRNPYVEPEKNLLAGGVATVLERALSYSLDSQEYPFDDTALAAVRDFLVPGRGIARVHFEEETNEDGDQKSATVWCEHVSWDEFIHQPAKRWDRVHWIAFEHYMTRDELVEEFGADIGNRVKLEYDSYNPKDPDKDKYGNGSNSEEYQTALVREIWDETERKVRWMSPGLKDEFCKVQDDPLGLDLFFPTPKPLLFLKRPCSLVPVPPYSLYRDQADELNLVTSRISGITDAMRVRGVYPANMSEIMQLVSATGHLPDLTPIDNWSSFAEKGGLEGVISWMPLEQLAKALMQLSARRQQLVQEIFEITGIADIIRGTTDPTETARAQTLKSQYATRRLRPMQRQVQDYVKNLLRLEAEIISEKFSAAALQGMTGVQIVPEMVASMSKDELRAWLVDIETDSTVAEEELYEKQEVIEMLGAFGETVAKIGPIVQAGAAPFDLLKQALLMVIKPFHFGKQFEAAIQSMKQPPPPPPDPKINIMAADVQRKAKEADDANKIEAARLMLDHQNSEVENAVAIAGALQ